MSDAGSKPADRPDPTDPKAGPGQTETPQNTLTLTKGRHRFQVKYARGDESTALAHLTEMAQTRPGGFDWFDAAVLSHQLGRHLAREVKAMAPGTPTKRAA